MKITVKKKIASFFVIVFFLIFYLEELLLFECKGTIAVLVASITLLGMLFTVFQGHASTEVRCVLRGSSNDMTSQYRV